MEPNEMMNEQAVSTVEEAVETMPVETSGSSKLVAGAIVVVSLMAYEAIVRPLGVKAFNWSREQVKKLKERKESEPKVVKFEKVEEKTEE